MSVLVFSFFPDFLAIFISITILGNAHRPCKHLSNITTPSLFFSLIFFLFFFIWNYKICHIWQLLVFILVTGFQCHSVAVNSEDCSGEITRISKFCGRSEILAGKFHWNGTGIRRNDRNPAGICRASLRPLISHKSLLTVICILFCTTNFRKHYFVVLQFDIFGQ